MSDRRPSFVLVTDNPQSWSLRHTESLAARLTELGYRTAMSRDIASAPAADIAVYLSCERVIPAAQRARFRNNVVVHASALPRGRGWSPLTWSIIEGANRVTLCLFEAADAVDAGPIYLTRELAFEGHELIDELRDAVAAGTESLVLELAERWPDLPAREQVGEPTFYARRRPVDSKLDPDRSLRDNFNLLRTVDNERYPAYFEHAGYIYDLRITKRGPVE